MRRIPAAGYLCAVVGNGALLALLIAFREQTTPLSEGFALMVVVVVSAVVGGLGPGIVASTLGFLAFNWAFIPPYGTLYIARAEDVVVLLVFLGLSVLISVILALESERRAAVEAREKELATLNELSRQLVTLVPGRQTYTAALEKMVDLFGFSAGVLLISGAEATNLREVAWVGAQPGDIDIGWQPEGEPAPVRAPLSVGARNLGLIVLTGERPPLTVSEARVLRSFCNEVALVLERDRLIEVAENAEVFRRTDAVRRALLGAVSHELRSPLAAIKASVTDLLSEECSSLPDYHKEALEAVNGETDRLDGLITNLLDMTRIEAGNLRARIQVCDLSEAISRCVHRIKAGTSGHPVNVVISGEAQMVQADPVFLERVLTNLLENAVKVTPPGTVTVKTAREGGEVVVRVVDSGPGVPPALRKRVFQPFYGLDQDNARLGQGLGLAICKGFVEAMEGDIWIEGTEGGGATFAFSLSAPAGGK